MRKWSHYKAVRVADALHPLTYIWLLPEKLLEPHPTHGCPFSRVGKWRRAGQGKEGSL